jgi:TRAP-type uncharacterized transport system substrate-binding protein
MKHGVTTLATLALVFYLGAVGSAADLRTITGGENGTYYRFGLHLQTLSKQSGVDLAVHTSKGSNENVYAGYQRPGIEMDIVQ